MVTAESADAEIPAGTVVLGRYQVVGKLAQGGMAEVYLARQVGPGGYQKNVVIKRVRPHLAKDDDFVGMFVNEARLAAMINHPNVVQIFDLGEEPSTANPGQSDWFLAMEYLDGRDMLQVGRACRAHNKAVPFDVTARIIADACSGLEHAHNLKGADGTSLDLVHRDMSPENIIITFEGQVKVVDFGIAKAADNTIRTQAGQIKGKLGYVAPEAILGKPLDARADVFAVGATLYLFLSGRPAFTGTTPMEIFERSLKAPPAPREVNPRVPELLDEICMKALAQDRDKRFRTAGDVRAALEGYLQNTGRPLGSPQLAQFMRILFPTDKDPVRDRIEKLLESAKRFEAPKPQKGLPRSVSVAQAAVANPAADRNSDQDRTAVAIRPDVTAPAAISVSGPDVKRAPQAVDLHEATLPASGNRRAAGPAHLRSVGVAEQMSDASDSRARRPTPTALPPIHSDEPANDIDTTHVTKRDPMPKVTPHITAEEEVEVLRTVDVQALSSQSRLAVEDATIGAASGMTDEIREARDAIGAGVPSADVPLDDPSDQVTVQQGAHEPPPPPSSDPGAPPTVQSPFQRSFTSNREPETGAPQGTELPPPFEVSMPGMPRPQASELSGEASGEVPPASLSVSRRRDSQALFDPPASQIVRDSKPMMVDDDPDTGAPGLGLKLAMALLGAATGAGLLLVILQVTGHLGAVLGR